MKTSALIKLGFALALAAGFSLQAMASGNPARGQELSITCHACHGEDGNLALADDYPIIAGQHFSYLVHALRAYRDGDRDHAIMSSFARGLSDQDIRDLAAWYARQRGPLGP